MGPRKVPRVSWKTAGQNGKFDSSSSLLSTSALAKIQICMSSGSKAWIVGSGEDRLRSSNKK